MFKKHKKLLEKAGYKVYTDKVTTPRGDVVAEVSPYGEVETKEPEILQILATPIVEKKKKKKVEDLEE